MSTSPSSSGKGRAIAARIVTIVAIVLALIGGIAFYLERSVLDEGGFKTIATELILSDEIREQVAGTAVEELYANVDVEQAVLAPPIGARARLVVREMRPRIAIVALVLANRTPLALAEVWSPFLPGNAGFPRVVQPRLFCDVDDSWLGHWGASFRVRPGRVRSAHQMPTSCGA